MIVRDLGFGVGRRHLILSKYFKIGYIHVDVVLLKPCLRKNNTHIQPSWGVILD